MKVLYIAGPYRSPDGWHAVWENIMRARAAARRAWLKGWAVICPHTNSIMMDGTDVEDRTFLDGDLEILGRCDALLAIPGWEKSEGAKREILVAENMGIPVYTGAEIPSPEEVPCRKSRST